MSRIVDTYSDGYPMIEGLPCTNYNADEEFIFQINKWFPNIFNFEVISRKGSRNSRVDFLLKGNFCGNEFSNNTFYVYVFILYEGGNGRPHDDELRTQLGAHNVWTPDLSTFKIATNFRDNSNSDLSNKECYCIGIYKQDEDSHDVVFVGMPSEVLCKSETESISPTSAFQTYGEFVREAFLHGVYLHEKNFTASSTHNLLIFKPEYFLWYMKNRDELHIRDIDTANKAVNQVTKVFTAQDVKELCKDTISYITAIRTKPFLLLAGVSGTGKSRIVRKLAQCTVTEDLQKKYDKEYQGDDFKQDRWNLHSPANFELIQVKPNWHNSMDVVGYLSNIPEPHYVFTPFIDFIAKAWKHLDVPFFLCLDEMNLAPVEEYFAEFLSAIESRSFENGVYKTDPIIKPFNSFKEVGNDMINTLFPNYKASDTNGGLGKIVTRINEKGLTLPPNLIVIGTVNMDETTFSFSRKVLDRAMSIEMNEVDYSSFLTGQTDDKIKALVEQFEHDNGDEILNRLLVERHIEAKEVIGGLGGNKEDGLAKRVLNYLDAINSLLEGTPFKLGYRAANEAIIYLQSAIDFGNNDFVSAMDNFTLMKILSRIEGDETKLSITDTANDTERLNKANVDKQKAQEHGNLTILTTLREIISQHLGETYLVETEREEDNAEESTEETIEQSEPKTNTKSAEKLNSIKKIDSMISQLERDHFVTYWN